MTSMKPKISVITGYYKRANVVKRTLSALVDQTFSEIEIIVFDDASPDGTADSIRDFIQSTADPRIVPIYHSENIGFVKGLINAIAHAQGEYIAIQGSGDVSWPERLAKQCNVLDSHPEIGVVGCHYENVVESTGIHRLRTPDADMATLESMLRQNEFSHGEVMFRKSYYDMAGGYRPQFVFCQDYDLWLRMIKICRFATVKELQYTRFVDFEGVSYKPEKFLAQTRLGILAQKLALLPCEQQRLILEDVSQGTILKHVPLSDAALQKKIVHAVIRAAVWGNFNLAKELTQKFITHRGVKALLQMAVTCTEKIPFVHQSLMKVTGSSRRNAEK